VLYTFVFFTGLWAMGLIVVSVIQLRWATAFWALALTWAMTSARSHLDEVALAVLVCGLTVYEIRAGFKTAKARPKMDQAEHDKSSLD
jgi:hypothetical protein